MNLNQNLFKVAVPVLETERLKLRGHQLSDFSDCVAMWSDPRVTRYTIGIASDEQRTWQRLLAYLGHWSLLGYGYWAVEEKQSKRYIGEVGFADFKRTSPWLTSNLKTDFLNGKPELGWALAPQFHGRGYATEALAEALEWGDRHLGVDTTACLIYADNQASLRVAEKLGFRECARFKNQDEVEIIFNRKAF